MSLPESSQRWGLVPFITAVTSDVCQCEPEDDDDVRAFTAFGVDMIVWSAAKRRCDRFATYLMEHFPDIYDEHLRDGPAGALSIDEHEQLTGAVNVLIDIPALLGAFEKHVHLLPAEREVEGRINFRIAVEDLINDARRLRGDPDVGPALE